MEMTNGMVISTITRRDDASNSYRQVSYANKKGLGTYLNWHKRSGSVAPIKEYLRYLNQPYYNSSLKYLKRQLGWHTKDPAYEVTSNFVLPAQLYS